MLPYKHSVLCPLRNHEAEQTNPVDDMMVLCTKNCGWYNKEDDECAILTLAVNTKFVRHTLEDIESLIKDK